MRDAWDVYMAFAPIISMGFLIFLTVLSVNASKRARSHLDRLGLWFCAVTCGWLAYVVAVDFWRGLT